MACVSECCIELCLEPSDAVEVRFELIDAAAFIMSLASSRIVSLISLVDLAWYASVLTELIVLI